ncbi:MAG: fused MFS/spermidine synthase [Magnetospirillum sp.]|nr:fused MFS/spermidine synthase [Magnetospirillum sp.]
MALGPLLHLNAVATGFVVMAFEMLGSRYLNPYFGSGIYTWAALISVVLAALAVGYFVGGAVVDRRPSPRLLGAIVAAAALYLLAIPLVAGRLCEAILAAVDDVRFGSLMAATALILVPVGLLGTYSPFAIRLTLSGRDHSGRTSGRIYGLSTVGSIVGTLVCTFVLIPTFGTIAITLALGGLCLLSGLSLLAGPRAPVALAMLAATLLPLPARAADGAVAEIETEYNNIFITRRGPYVKMSFLRGGADYTESVVNLTDPGELAIEYTRTMTLGLAFSARHDTALMIGLGGGAVNSYLHRAVKGMAIDVVEIDPGVIRAAKTHFGLAEGNGQRLIAADGRVQLMRTKTRYDLILVDAYRGGYVPFHMMTAEFYTLVKRHLEPGGAAVFNLHSGTRLFDSTIKTLRTVFPSVHTFAAGGNVVAICQDAGAKSLLEAGGDAQALDARYRFRYPLAGLLASRVSVEVPGNTRLFTDDFSPAGAFEAIAVGNRKRE